MSAAAGRSRGELRVWAGLLFAAAVFVGAGVFGQVWHPHASVPLEPPWLRTPRALFDAIEALGDWGRQQNRDGVLTLDTIIPLSYGWAMFRAARFYLGRLGAPRTLRWLRRVPVVAMACDFAENACIVTLLGVYPAQPVAVAAALIAFAWTKWILLAATAVGIICGWVLLRFRRPSPRLAS